jgi:hypothetical protein
MCSTPFPSFHKVWDDLILEELTLGINMPVPPPQAFYTNNTPDLPPPTPSRPPGNGGQGQGQGRDHRRNCKNDVGSGGDDDSNTFG